MTPGLVKVLTYLWILIWFSAVVMTVWTIVHFIHKWW